MLGDVLLRGAEGLLQSADRRLPVTKVVEQLDPHRLAEYAKTLGNELDQGRWERVRGGIHSFIVPQAYGCGSMNRFGSTRDGPPRSSASGPVSYAVDVRDGQSGRPRVDLP